MSMPRPLFGSTARGSVTPSRGQSLKARPIRHLSEPVPPAQIDPAPIPVGRRGAARLRLSLPAKLVSLYATHRCILIDLSCTGAQVGLEDPLDKNETAFLQIADAELFCEVVRKAQGSNGGINGVLFDPPLVDQDVLDMRAFADTYQAEVLRGFKAEVKDWVDGVI